MVVEILVNPFLAVKVQEAALDSRFRPILPHHPLHLHQHQHRHLHRHRHQEIPPKSSAICDLKLHPKVLPGMGSLVINLSKS